MQILRNLIVHFTAFAFLFANTVALASSSTWVFPVPSSDQQGTWSGNSVSTKGGLRQGWVEHPVNTKNGLQTITLPKDSYTILSETDYVKPRQTLEEEWEMIDVPEWITRNMPSIGRMGGLKEGEFIGKYIKPQPTTPPIVFAVYSPEATKLRIWVQKVELLPNNKITVAVKEFTPHHGRHWQVTGAFRTASEKASDPNGVGINPFAAFAGAESDPVFNDISWSAAVVAIGQAMMHERAAMGWIATPEVRYAQNKKKSGNLLKKKVKYTTQAFVKPNWWFVGAAELVSGGQHHAICVGPEAIANPNAGCTDIARVANSGVLVKPWKGGLPSQEEKLYEHVKKTEGFTVLFFTLLTFAVFAGAGALFSGAGGMAATGASASAGGGGGLGALGTGALAGGAYATISTGLLHQGITQAQAGYLGKVSSGVLKPASSGAHETNVSKAIINRFLLPAIHSGASHPSISQWFGLDCPQHLSVAQCNAQGKSPGAGWRSDSFGIEKVVRRMARDWKRCKAAGYTGETLHKCAAGDPTLLMSIQ